MLYVYENLFHYLVPDCSFLCNHWSFGESVSLQYYISMSANRSCDAKSLLNGMFNISRAFVCENECGMCEFVYGDNCVHLDSFQFVLLHSVSDVNRYVK